MEFLVDSFYKKVIVDDVIGFIFTEVVKLDWNIHIPVMYDFWESMLFMEQKYQGNPMLVHLGLNQKEPLLPEHFERWLNLWEETVREHYAGTKAQEAISRSKHIGGVMQFKMAQHEP